jgi:hypothetical protein
MDKFLKSTKGRSTKGNFEVFKQFRLDKRNTLTQYKRSMEKPLQRIVVHCRNKRQSLINQLLEPADTVIL